MENRYAQTIKHGERVLHKAYSLYRYGRGTAYDGGAIRFISVVPQQNSDDSDVEIICANGDVFRWSTKWLDVYTGQFGVGVSFDGNCVFAQTWENGIRCLDTRTGKTIWKTKSRKGITSIFVNNNTILCHQHGRALQILDSATGEVLAEKRPATAWGFTALDHGHIICQMTARRWEIIDVDTLETKETFSHKVFTDGHIDYSVKDITLLQDGRIRVFGFTNAFDDSVTPPRMLPNPEFEAFIDSQYFKQLCKGQAAVCKRNEG